MKLQLNFQIVRFLNYKQRFSDSLPPQKNSLTRWLVDLLTQNATEKAAPRVVWARVLVVV